ncbi:hypothetical protein HaLaN_25165, partial [Haematococcus lacustris]
MRRIPALRELLSTLKHRLSAERCNQLTGSAATASLSTTASAPAGRPVPKVSVDVVVTGFRKPAVGPPCNPECLKPGFVKRSIPHSLQAIQSSPSILAVNPHPHGSQAKTKDMKAKDGPATAGHPAVSLCQALHQAGYWHAAHWAALTRILNNTALKHDEKQAVDTALAWAAGMQSSHA